MKEIEYTGLCSSRPHIPFYSIEDANRVLLKRVRGLKQSDIETIFKEQSQALRDMMFNSKPKQMFSCVPVIDFNVRKRK